MSKYQIMMRWNKVGIEYVNVADENETLKNNMFKCHHLSATISWLNIGHACKDN